MARMTRITPINSAELAGDALEGRDERLRRRSRRQADRAAENRARANARDPRKRKKRRQARNQPAPAPTPSPAPAPAPAWGPGGGRPRLPMRRVQARQDEGYEDEGYDESDEDEVNDEDEAVYEDEEGWDEEIDPDTAYLAGMRVELGRALPRAQAQSLWYRIRDRVRRARTQRAAAMSTPARTHAARPSAPAARPAAPAAAERALTQTPTWGPVVWLGKNIVIQVRTGHRVASLQLRPGMWIVAEIPEVAVMPTTEGGFGLAPLVAPALVSAARRALGSPEARAERREARQQARQNGEGLLKRIFNPGTTPHPALPGPTPQPAAHLPPSPLTLAGCCAWCDEGDGP